MLKLFFNCVPHALSLIDVVLVIALALTPMVGSRCAFAILMFSSLVSMPSCTFLISGRCAMAAA